MKLIREKRSLFIYLLLSVLTFGIYAIYHQYMMICDINTMLKEDGKKTPQVFWLLLLFVPTLTLYPLFWHCALGNRLRANLRARNIPCAVGGGGQLLLVLLGRQCLPLLWIAQYNVIHACNDLAKQYNAARAQTASATSAVSARQKAAQKQPDDLYW